MKSNKCTRCGKELKGESVVTMELSNTDGHYYHDIPKDHVSQGFFIFGQKCAILEGTDTIIHLSKLIDERLKN